MTVDMSGDKPRPSVIVQTDDLLGSSTILVCLLTSDVERVGRHRLSLEPNVRNGLRKPSLIMSEKIHAVAETKIGPVVGSLNSLEMRRLGRQLAFVLGLGD